MKYVCIYYDGNETHSRLVDLSPENDDGPFGVTPDDIGLSEECSINALIELPDDLIGIVEENDPSGYLVVSSI